MTNQQLHEIFIDQAPLIKRAYKGHIDRLNAYLVDLEATRRKIRQDTTEYNQQWFVDIANEMFNERRAEALRIIKKYAFLIGSFNPREVKPGQITDTEIYKAKQVPIETLYHEKLRRVSGKLIGRCPLGTHQDSSPSFTIYVSQNSWWAYCCSTGGSVVDYVMKTQKLNFLDAVRKLI